MEEPLNSTNEFWEILVEGGVLDRDLATEFRDRLDSEWVPLGQILIRQKALDLAQVMGLMGIQAGEPDQRLGDLAIREGMCTPEQIEVAVAEQRRFNPHPIELLARDSRVDTSGFFGTLIEYVRWLEGQLHGQETS